MTFGTAIKTCLAKYATFQGRARRSEYWYFVLLVVLLSVAEQVIGAVAHSQVVDLVFGLVQLALALPGIAVAVRRLHDIDRSGWWYLLGLVPIVGLIVLVVWFCRTGTAGPNRFGDESPDSTDAPPVVA